MLSPEIESLVKKWLELDPNPTTRVEIETLWQNGNIDELQRRLGSRIEFGTAGLRGKMEAGWARMNDLIVLQASKGLASYVADHVSNALDRGLVVGHDHRYHSEHWAFLTATVFAASGFKVYFLEDLVPTPLVPFSVKVLNAACGVMITASHNPKQDNGYKVYWENAVQIISPHDVGIADAITMISGEKIATTGTLDDLRAHPLYTDKTDELSEMYFASLVSSRIPPVAQSDSVTFVNTSMHGVSDRFVSRAFSLCGHPKYLPVEEQRNPDPEFPTVKFPNPEEKGALDLALATAQRQGAQYILAQDPDSDRFSAAEKSEEGVWTFFTGDQLGALFAFQAFEEYKQTGKPLSKLAMVASTVSSKMVEAVAMCEGFVFKECLTGFKYIGNTALDLTSAGYEVPFGYEEAIGFMFGTVIRDKDGVAASVRFVDLIMNLRARGTTAAKHLDSLYERYGHFKTNNGYFTCSDPLLIDRIFLALRTSSEGGRKYPTSLGRLPITRVVDLTGSGYDSGNPPTYEPSLPVSSGHMIQFRAGGSEHRFQLTLTLRTSGTEPKIKYYLEGSGSDASSLEDILSEAVQDIVDNWIQSTKHNLGHATA